MLLASDAGGLLLRGAWFIGQKYFAAGIDGPMIEVPEAPVFKEAREWLNIYFSGRNPGETPPLDPLNVTPFRRAVWAAMKEIPYGCVSSYSGLALSIGAGKRASRAVGGAVAQNPLIIFLPCHRVMPSGTGGTGQFAAGAERKKQLLSLEKTGNFNTI